MTHETGATWLYHGQSVSFEWQSLQERSKTFRTWGGTGSEAYIVFEGSTGGFVFLSGMNCATTRAATSASAILLNQRVRYDSPPRRRCAQLSATCRCHVH